MGADIKPTVGDVDGDLLTLEVSVDFGLLSIGSQVGSAITKTDNAAGLNSALLNLRYAPPGDFTGTATVLFRVSDGIETTTDTYTFDVRDDGAVDVNDPPELIVDTVTADLSEVIDTSDAILIASFTIIDDVLGTNSVSLTGPNADQFEVVGGDVFLKAGTVLDFETQEQLLVLVEVDDPTVGFSPDDFEAITVAIIDEAEAPVIEPQSFTIEESSADGFVVGMADASDLDAADSHVFSLQDTSVFSIDPHTGTIAVADSSGLDFETSRSLQLIVTITDSTGLSDSAVVDIDLTDVNEAPTITANLTSLSIEEGQTAKNTGAFTDEDQGDIITLSASIGTVVDLGCGAWSWSFASSDGPDQSQTVTITAIDTAGLSASTSFGLFVDNVPPQNVTITGLPSGLTSPEGQLISLGSTFVDPGSLDTHAYLWEVSASNGQMITDGTDADFSFTPSDNGTYYLSLTVEDDDGGSATQRYELSITNVNPTIDEASLHNSAIESGTTRPGDAISVSVQFVDPGFDDPAGGTLEDFTASTIDWGDGIVQAFPTVEIVEVVGGPATATTGTVGGTHVYAHAGVYTVTITVMDDDGSFDTATTQVIMTGVGIVDGTLYVIGTEGQDVVQVERKGKNGINIKGKFDERGANERFNVDFPMDQYTIDKIVIVLGGGDDKAQVGKNIYIDALIYGGDGNDKLEGGSGSDILLGGTGDDQLDGSDGNDVLSGGEGDDQLNGGKGMGVFIGGSGKDDLKGRDGDLFIGGYTNFDDDPSRLASIREIWTSGNLLDDIVENLTGSGGLLQAGIGVFGDGDRDKLQGNKKSRDLFFAELGVDDLKDDKDDLLIDLAN